MRILLLLLVAAGAVAAQERSDYLEAYARLGVYFCEKRLELGDWCKSNKLPREARTHYQFIADKIPGASPYKSRAQNKLNGSWKKDPNTATPEQWAEYRKRYEDYAKGCGDRAWKTYLAAKKAKLAKEAEEALRKTAEFYLDHAEARKELGEEKVEGFGWVPAAEAELVRAALDWKDDRSADDAKHADWKSAWVIKSPRWILRTSYPWKRGVEALEKLERLQDVFGKTFGARFKEPAGRLGLCLFRTPDEAERIRAKIGGAVAPGGSFYHAGTNVTYVLWWDDSVLLHEATHQLIQNGLDFPRVSILQQGGVGSDSPDNYWLVEGVAVWFGTLSWKGDEPRFVEPKGFSGLVPPPLKDFVGMDFAQFQADAGRNYAVAHALVCFLVEEPEGGGRAARRERFLDFVKEVYVGTSTVAAFEKAAGAESGALDGEFRLWLKGRG